MQRKIVNKESFSVGKREGSNDDDIYIGKDFAAVIDGVSHKSSILVEGKKHKIAQIITEAIRKMDRQGAPAYAKTLSFEEFTKFINLYIHEYLQRYNVGYAAGNLEATGAIYSRYHNQIWIVGDCKAIYDGQIVERPIKTDEIFIDIRTNLIQALLEEGYTQEDLIKVDIARDIINYPKLLKKFIENPQTREKLKEYRAQRIKKALIECGFSEEEIEEQSMIKKYYNPRRLQQFLKNNPNMGDFGYAVFNGKYTETKNCKVVNLPDNVKTIKLFSDGFSVESLNNDKDIGDAVRTIRARAKKDPLSVKNNLATHNAVKYSIKENRIEEYAIDDASAIVIEIKQEERDDDERG